MAAKRKRSEADIHQENERRLRSCRTVKTKSSTDKALKSPNSKLRSSPRKAAVNTDVRRFEIAGTEQPLKPSKGTSPLHQQRSVADAKDLRRDDETRSVGLNTHQKSNQIHALGDTIICSPRTPKRNQVAVEISPKRPSTRRLSQARRHSLHENALNSDANPLSFQLPVCLAAQKKEILRSLQASSFDDLDVPATEAAARKQLSEMIQGSMTRGEGNSCIVLGPRGCGKTRIVESCIHNLAAKPIILRLSGWVQTTDKHALREIAMQLLHQTGSYLLSDTEPPDPSFVDDDDDGNPFIDQPQAFRGPEAEQSVRLPPSSQLHALIPVLLTLKRPVIVILDAFDLFALHPRQSLLYCLLDNVQSCRSTSGSQGIAVIGVTSRVDTIQLLEKRVKSRFSGRIIRTGPTNGLDHWLSIAKNALLIPITLPEECLFEEWHKKWIPSVEDFLSDLRVLDVLRETFGISKDVKVLIRLLTQSILQLRPSEPYLSYKILSASVDLQRSRPRYTHVNNLSYPMVCLIIASSQVEVTGHPTFSFEMLYEKFRDQFRASTSAPVQLNGGHVGMVKCTREVLLAAFDDLVSSRTFVPSVGPSTVLAKEFIRHRCVLDREMMKKIVEKSGQIHLKRWFNKG